MEITYVRTLIISFLLYGQLIFIGLVLNVLTFRRDGSSESPSISGETADSTSILKATTSRHKTMGQLSLIVVLTTKLKDNSS